MSSVSQPAVQPHQDARRAQNRRNVLSSVPRMAS